MFCFCICLHPVCLFKMCLLFSIWRSQFMAIIVFTQAALYYPIVYLPHNNLCVRMCVCLLRRQSFQRTWVLCKFMCMCVCTLWIYARVHGQIRGVTSRLGILRAQVGRRWMSNHVWYLDRVYECVIVHICVCVHGRLQILLETNRDSSVKSLQSVCELL